MNDLDFFVTCVGIFKMAKPSRMNRHFEICEKMILRWSSFKSMVHFYKTLQFSLEIGGLCLGVIHGTYNVTVIGPVSKEAGWSWPF